MKNHKINATTSSPTPRSVQYNTLFFRDPLQRYEKYNDVFSPCVYLNDTRRVMADRNGHVLDINSLRPEKVIWIHCAYALLVMAVFAAANTAFHLVLSHSQQRRMNSFPTVAMATAVKFDSLPPSLSNYNIVAASAYYLTALAAWLVQ